PHVGQVVIGGVPGGVTARLAGPARAAAETWVVEEEHPELHLPQPVAEVVAAVAEVAGVAVTEQHRPLPGLPTRRGGPPGVDPAAVTARKLDVFDRNAAGRRRPVLRGPRVVQEPILQRQEQQQDPEVAVQAVDPEASGPVLPRALPEPGLERDHCYRAIDK